MDLPTVLKCSKGSARAPTIHVKKKAAALMTADGGDSWCVPTIAGCWGESEYEFNFDLGSRPYE